MVARRCGIQRLHKTRRCTIPCLGLHGILHPTWDTNLPLPHDELIPANLAAFPQKDGDALGAGQRLQEAPLNGKPVCGSLMRAAVDSSVGYMDAPQPGLAVEVLQVRRPGRGDEVFLHVPEESLHLSLGLSPVRSTQSD